MDRKILKVWLVLEAIGIIYVAVAQPTDFATLYGCLLGWPVLGVVFYLLGYFVTRDDPDNYKSGWTF